MEQELTFFQGYKQLICWFALAARLNLLKSPDILGEERWSVSGIRHIIIADFFKKILDQGE